MEKHFIPISNFGLDNQFTLGNATKDIKDATSRARKHNERICHGDPAKVYVITESIDVTETN